MMFLLYKSETELMRILRNADNSRRYGIEKSVKLI